MALLERLEIVIEADARTAEREFDRIGRQATESLQSIEDAAGKVGDNAAEQLSGASSKFTQAGRELSDAAGRGLEDLSAAAREAAAALPRAVEDQRQEAEQAGRRVGKQAGEGVADGVRDARSQVNGAATDLGAGVGDGVSGGLLAGLGDLGGDLGGAFDEALSALPPAVAGPATALGAAVGAAFVVGISDAIEAESLGDLIAARVGEGAAQSEQFARVTSQVFRDAWGESTAEVADAVDAVYSTLSDSRGSEAALQDLTTRAQAFAEVFNQDVGQAVSNAGVLIETGLARDAVDAFDLMTAAAQRVPAAMRDELGEATQEYSTFFATLGFDGRESFSILTDAAQEGRYELDKTGDAVKELSIRATDLADTTAMSGLRDLGLDARDTATALLEGGDAARTATQQILDALNSVEDPAEQARIAIALMGAPLEDLNKAEIPEFIDRLADASGGMQDAAGSSDRLVGSLENAKTNFTELFREFRGGFADTAGSLFDPILTLAGGDAGFGDVGKAAANSFWEAFTALPAGALTDTVTDFVTNAVDMVPFSDILVDNLNQQLPNGVSLGVSLIFGGTEAAPDVPKDSPLWDAIYGDGEGEGEVTVSADATQASMSIDEVNKLLQLSGELADLASDRAQNYLSRIANSSNLDDAITAQLNLRDAAAELLDGLTALQGVDITAFADGTEQVSDDAAAALGDVAGAASAAQEQIANALEWEGDAAAVEKAGELRDEFVRLFDAAGLTDEQIIDLLASMGLLPEQVNTAITLSGEDEAIAKLTLLRDFYTNADGSSGIPSEINTQVGVAIAEGRFTDAANLISIWVKDTEDGYIDDPLLVAMGLGSTDEAQSDVDTFIRTNDGRRFTITMDLITNFVDEGIGAFPIFGGSNERTGRPPVTNRPGRAVGGPMLGGAQYEVNERGQELFVSKDGGYMVNASNLKQLMNNLAAVAKSGGGSGVVVNQQITTADPVQAGSEAARRMRDASYLVGV